MIIPFFLGETMAVVSVQAHSHSGHPSHTGIGFANGVVGILNALTLAEVCQPFRYARDSVTHIAFSHDSLYMATAVSHTITSPIIAISKSFRMQDIDLCVTVYVARPESEEQPWEFLAKHRAHYKQIVGELGGGWHVNLRMCDFEVSYLPAGCLVMQKWSLL